MNELEIASYLDRGLAPGDRDRLESHLAQCAECRESVTATQQVLHQITRKKRAVGVIGVLTFAAVALIMIRPRMVGDGADLERSSTTSESVAITAYTPLGTVRLDSRRFIWAKVANAISYRLTLSGADGASVWSYSGTDTIAVLPSKVGLHSGVSYFWVVDAVAADGSIRSTGMQEFHPE